MSTTSNINGIELYNALVSGICKVISRHEHLNKINVFPVPDGDTGTNLLFTLKPILNIQDSVSENINTTLTQVSDVAIDSARGNSGTIMAQYFIGMAEKSSDITEINNKNIFDLLDGAYNAAKQSMAEPKEGTIITVMRDIAIESKNHIDSDDIENTFNACLSTSRAPINILTRLFVAAPYIANILPAYPAPVSPPINSLPSLLAIRQCTSALYAL